MDPSNSPFPSRRDAEAWLRLTLVPGVSPGAQRKLLSAIGSAEEVLASPARRIAEITHAGVAALLAKGPEPRLLDATLRWTEVKGHHLLVLDDPDYPRLLLETADPPNVLYAVGRIELLGTTCVAVVGSRNCTPRGALDARAFAQALSERGLCIVSGLALGIDAQAHRGGLDGAGSSIAVMGTGADILYPPRNRDLAHEIAAKGCLLTEFPLGTHSASKNFPRRNRLISGLSRGALVVEAAKRSGSLITAHYAIEQNRDVFAVPGSIHSPQAKGCHLLIKDGAKLAESAQDILIELGLEPASAPEEDIENDDDCPHPLLDAIAFAPLTVDQIVQLTGASTGSVTSALSLLEVEGRVQSMPGGRFQRTPHTTSPPGKPAPSRVIE